MSKEVRDEIYSPKATYNPAAATVAFSRVKSAKRVAALVIAPVLICGLFLCSCRPTEGPRSGQIVSDPLNPTWLVRYDPRGDHSPVFLCGPGDPEGLLYEDTSVSPSQILKKMREHGGNAIYVIAVRSHGGDGTPEQNPFFDHDPKKGVDPAILRRWHKILKPFDRAGIAIHLFLYDDGAQPFGKGMGDVSEDEERFIEAVVNRFEAYKNVIWNIAEEYREGMTLEHAKEVARIIAKYDDRDHVIGISQRDVLTFDFEDDPHIGLWHIQSDCESPEHAHDQLIDVAERANGRYNLIYSEIYRHGYRHMQENNRIPLRKLAWAVAMAGVPVMHGGMWHPSWQPHPLDGILADMQRIHAFMQSIPDLTAHVSRDELKHGSTQYVLANTGRSWIAYTLDGTRPLGLTGLSDGKYSVRWFDCVTGRESKSTDSDVIGGDHLWHKPQSFGKEVALYVTKRGGGVDGG